MKVVLGLVADLVLIAEQPIALYAAVAPSPMNAPELDRGVGPMATGKLTRQFLKRVIFAASTRENVLESKLHTLFLDVGTLPDTGTLPSVALASEVAELWLIIDADSVLSTLPPAFPDRKIMPIDYLAVFPIPEGLLPAKLRVLLTQVGLDPQERVQVSAMFEGDDVAGLEDETLHLVMAVVPEVVVDDLGVPDAAGNGVVAFSVPVLREKGNSAEFSPSVSGHDYVVASWGDGSFYTYSLSEKVWMALGLTATCLGNDDQRLVYDDLGLPEFGIADGEVSANYEWEVSRNVSWRMSNEYLRKYLWMRGAVGVRCFYYAAIVPDTPELRGVMDSAPGALIRPPGDWCEVDIREDDAGLHVQVWATVAAVSCELCAEQSAEGLEWPGLEGPMTHLRANAQLHGGTVYLEDRFLERYERSSFYGTTPNRRGDTNPSYRGQWSFTDCERVGRSLIRVPIRELYKPKPDREIVHAHRFVVDPGRLAGIDLGEEHIVAKTQRLLAQLLDLGDNLGSFGVAVGVAREPAELTGFSRAELDSNGWRSYSQLSRLAQVAPLDMSQRAFLSRCKSLHELWQRIPNGFLRLLLLKAGCPQEKIQGLGSLKLLQGMLNIVEQLDAHQETVTAFANREEPDGWARDNERMAPLFLNNDLRIADAHDAVGKALRALQSLGFDTAGVAQGYGRALDFLFDGVIGAFEATNGPMRRMLER